MKFPLAKTRVTHRNVQKLSNRLVVSGSAVGHGERVHPRPPQDRVLVGHQLGYEWIRLLEAAVHGERYADREAAQDFLVLTLAGILQKWKYKKMGK